MGQVDTLLKYGPYNTYHMDPNETLYATPFDVTYYGDIVIQLVAINPAQATSATLHLRWIDADNKKIGDDTVETFSITQVFSDWWKSFSVPSNAKKLHWWIKAGDVGFNWGCGMVSPGTMMRAFSDNVSDRTSLLTAKGLYTSTISANQILAGILMALSRLAWFDLEKPEIVMKGDDATWKASPENPLELTDKEGNFIGGIRIKDGKAVFVTGILSNDPNLGSFAEIGYSQEGYAGIVLHSSDDLEITIAESEGKSVVILRNGYGIEIAHNSYRFFNDQGQERFSLNSNGSVLINGVNGEYRFVIEVDGTYNFYDRNEKLRMLIASDGGFAVFDGQGRQRLNLYPSGDCMFNSPNGNTLGVNDQGAYKIISGVETAL